MMALLSFDQVLLVFGAAVSSELVRGRNSLLAGIPAALTETLPIHSTEAALVLSDLHALNAIGTLRDGSVPLRSWLANAVALSGGRRETEVFEQAKLICEGGKGKNGDPEQGSQASNFKGEYSDQTPWWAWIGPVVVIFVAVALAVFVLVPLFSADGGPKSANKLVVAAVLGATLQEGVHWYSLRRGGLALGGAHRTLLKSPGYWMITIAFVAMSSFGVLLWYHGTTPAPRDCLLAGAALPALIKQLISGVSTATLPKLGVEKKGSTRTARLLLSRFVKILAAYLKLN